MKKTLNIIRVILTWLLVVAAVGMMIFTIVSVNTFDRNDRSLFGYKAYIVRSDSMNSVNGDTSKGYFDSGDLIFIKELDNYSDLQAGEIISYTSTNTENFGETVTHMIRSKVTDAEGVPGFITYGTTTDTNDNNIVTYPYVLGKYTGRLAGVGTFFQFLKTTPGYIVCIFLPCLILIGIQGFNSIKLFKKYKREQMAELDAQHEKEKAELQAEREAMEAERKRQEEMMKKLLEMQVALQSNMAKQEAPKEEEKPFEEATTEENKPSET